MEYYKLKVNMDTVPANEINKESLQSLLSKIHVGKLLLPNFQRGFQWSPRQWKSLFASLLLRYPTGMILVGTNAKSDGLQMKDTISRPNKELINTYKGRLEESKIKYPESFEGDPHELLEEAEDGYTCELLLDGQQRLSSLDLMMGNAAAECPGNELHYSRRFRWFLNITELGLYDLEWKKIGNISHNEAMDMIEEKPYRIGKSNNWDFGLSEESLINGFCFHNDVENTTDYRSILIPIDAIYNFNDERYNPDTNNYERCFSVNFKFVDRLIKIHRESILRRVYGAERGQELGADEEIPESKKSSLEDRLQQWKYRLRDLIKGIPETRVPVIHVSAFDFNRIAGIFSVINISGVNLDTFDLLVAKTAKAGSTIRDEFMDAVYNFVEDTEIYFDSLVHNKIKSTIDDDYKDDFWKLSTFIGEKSSIASEVDSGDEFPEKRNKVFAQVIALISRISKALNEDNITDEESWFSTNFSSKIEEESKKKRVITSILSLGKDWKFGDNEILNTSREAVWDHAQQAATQLLRAMYFCTSRLGVRSYTSLPYKQMLLVIACAMTDEVWENITTDGDLNDWRCLKLEKWYWCSIFGGAYQKRQDARVREDIPRLLIYLHDKSASWQDFSSVEDDTDKVYNESPIQGTDSNRFESLLDAPAYSSKSAITQGENGALSKTIQSFQLRDGMYDLRDKTGKYRLLHAGIENVSSDSLTADHIVAIGAWNERLVPREHEVQRNDSNHPINSPLNLTPCSDKSNKYWGKTSDLIKFDIFLEDDSPPNFYQDHLITRGTLKNKLDNYTDIIDGSSKSNDQNMIDSILSPVLENRFENLKTELTKIIEKTN